MSGIPTWNKIPYQTWFREYGKMCKRPERLLQRPPRTIVCEPGKSGDVKEKSEGKGTKKVKKTVKT
ncbi:hypothetical protein J6590_079339 [Homalodisca vitripennis]|nr:hypothetical protein J6590_079339 [Homalodisca vitripennis]